MTCWHRWSTLDGPSGVLSEQRPYRVMPDGEVVVPTKRERAAERARRGRTGRRAPRGAPRALATLQDYWTQRYEALAEIGRLRMERAATLGKVWR